MAGYILCLYVPDAETADKAAADTLLDNVLDAGSGTSLNVTKTLDSTSYRYTALAFNLPNANEEGEPTANDDTLAALLNGLGTIATAKYSVMENVDFTRAEGRRLVVSNMSAASGEVWSVADSDAAVAGFEELATVYAAPNGTSDGAGTELDPVDLLSALTGFPKLATSAIQLAAGQYSLTENFSSVLSGAVEIVGAGIDNTELIVGGNDAANVTLRLYNNGCTFKNMRIRGHDDITRYTNMTGSSPDPVMKLGTLSMHGTGTQLKSVVIDNLSHTGWWREAQGGLMSGCLLTLQGWLAPDRAHGPGEYCQHKASSPPRVHRGSAYVNNYSSNIQAYGSSNTEVSNMEWEDTVFIGSRVLIGGPGDTEGIVFTDCDQVAQADSFSRIQLGNHMEANKDATLTNVIADRIIERPGATWESVTYNNCISLNTDPEPENNIIKIVDLQADNAEHLALVRIWNFEGLNSVNVDLSGLAIEGVTSVAVDMTTGTVAQPIGETGEDHGLPYTYSYYWEHSTMPRYAAFFLAAKAGAGYELRSVQDYFGDRRDV